MDKEQLYTLRWYVTNKMPAGQDRNDMLKILGELLGEQDPIPAPIPEEEPEERPEPPKTEMPTIVEVDVKCPAHGLYKDGGKARGCVVHFTAGRMSSASKSKKQAAIDTLEYLASVGLGCFCMDEDGIIYVPKTLGFNKIGYHAGKSAWKGISGVSDYCYGMEMVNAGSLTKIGEFYYPWFSLSGGRPKPGEPKYTGDQVRTVTVKTGNMFPGHYLKYSPEQEEALVNFLVWQTKTNPEFKLDWIMGHDSCATPTGRKDDPGGCLSMTIDELREKVKSLL